MRGVKRFSPRPVTQMDTDVGTVAGPGISGKVLCAAVEHSGAARHENEISTYQLQYRSR